ncbi:nucleoside transporter [Salmonella enterica]
MKDGIYRVVFENHLFSVGEGIVVVNGSRVYGGDIAFTCRGILTSSTVRLCITQFDVEIPSMLEMEDDYTLLMTYESIEDGEYNFNGHVENFPDKKLNAHAQFLVPLLP